MSKKESQQNASRIAFEMIESNPDMLNELKSDLKQALQESVPASDQPIEVIDIQQ